MTITKVTPNDWINIANESAHPDFDKFELRYIQLENSYAVHITSGYGSYLSQATNNIDDLPRLEKELREKYEKVKANAVLPTSFLTFKLA